MLTDASLSGTILGLTLRTKPEDVYKRQAMFLLNPGLAAAVILIVPVISLLTAWFQDRILRWNRRVRKMNSRITSAYNEGIMGARTSKTLVIEDQNCREFEEITQDMRVSSVKAARLGAVYIPVSYTHLDVYKRQPCGGKRRCAFSAR